MISRRQILAGLAATSFLPRGLHAAGAAGAIRYGWDTAAPAPQQATFHIAPHGDDAADGSAARPFAAIQRGVDRLAGVAGGSLAIHGGLYRETVSLDRLRGTSAAPYRIFRRGTDQVTVTAAEILTGWQRCSAADAVWLGVPIDNLFVARLPAARLEHGAITALNLHEAGDWNSIATDRADMSDPERTGDQGTYHSALFETDAQDRITAVVDPRLIGRAPAAMEQGQVRLYHRPNWVGTSDIADFDPRTGRIVLGKTDYAMQRVAGEPVMLYALQNTPGGLRAGSWIARRTPDGDIAVYLHPRDPAALAGGIEISLRPVCIDFGSAQFVELFGIGAVRASGEGLLDGICIRRSGTGGVTGHGLRIVNCRAGENFSANGRGYGAIFLRDTQGAILRQVSVGPTRGSFGLFIAKSTKADLRFLHISGVSQSPARFFTLTDSILAFSLFEDSGRDAHANKFNFYEGSDNVLVYGVRTARTGGYVTYQEASRIHFAFCEFDCDPTAGNRALVSQNRRPGAGQGGADGSGEPVAGATFQYWNNSLLADPQQAQKANSLSLGPAGSSQRHVLRNNILFGGGLASVYLDDDDPRLETRSHNAYSGLAYWQTPRYGWRPGHKEQGIRINARPSWPGMDMRPLIAELAPVFPGFSDWDRDIDGKIVDWNDPPIGARA